MLDKEEFILHRSIVTWLMENGSSFLEAMAVVSFAEQMNQSIPVAFINLGTDFKKNELKIN